MAKYRRYTRLKPRTSKKVVSLAKKITQQKIKEMGRKPKIPLEPKKRGRKKIIVNWDMVEKYVISGASGAQIAAVMGFDEDVLYKRCQEDHEVYWTDYSKEKWEKGNAGLHGKQYELAIRGDKQMLMWLGKQRLGQTDKHESKIETHQTISQKSILEIPDNGRRFVKIEDRDDVP